MNPKTISVVIPTFNASNTIEKALFSIINQTLLPLEIIVIDDASKDNTLEVIEAFLAQCPIPLITLRNQKNSGPSVSRNKGIQVAQGNWIAFLDADDFWHPRKLETQLSLLEQHQAYIIGSIATVSEKERLTNNAIKKITPFDMLWKNYFHTPTLLVKKSEHLFFNEDMHYSEDFELWTRLIKVYGFGIYTDEPLAYLGKEPYLQKGLSSNLSEMELGEIQVLMQEKNIFLRFAAISYSVLKFCRRLILRNLSIS